MQALKNVFFGKTAINVAPFYIPMQQCIKKHRLTK
jgi:hypothetical protein